MRFCTVALRARRTGVRPLGSDLNPDAVAEATARLAPSAAPVAVAKTKGREA